MDISITSKIRENNNNTNILHKSFEAAILLKGIGGLFETVGGILLLFLNPNRLNSVIAFLTQNELSKDPNDFVANYLVKFSAEFTMSSQYFGVFYLVSHGIIKLVLVILLWKRKLWAYPLAIASLVLFIVYQMYRFSISFSVSMILLTIFDVIMIVLTYIEYKNCKKIIVLNY